MLAGALPAREFYGAFVRVAGFCPPSRFRRDNLLVVGAPASVEARPSRRALSGAGFFVRKDAIMRQRTSPSLLETEGATMPGTLALLTPAVAIALIA